MNPLTTVSTEVQELQRGIDALGTSLQKIEQDLQGCHGSSKEIISNVLGTLDGVMAGLPERNRDLHKIEHALNQVRSRIRELTSRGKKIGQENLLSRQKERLSELRHIYGDLKSDLECIESFRANFQGRLIRLRDESGLMKGEN